MYWIWKGRPEYLRQTLLIVFDWTNLQWLCRCIKGDWILCLGYMGSDLHVNSNFWMPVLRPVRLCRGMWWTLQLLANCWSGEDSLDNQHRTAVPFSSPDWGVRGSQTGPIGIGQIASRFAAKDLWTMGLEGQGVPAGGQISLRSVQFWTKLFRNGSNYFSFTRIGRPMERVHLLHLRYDVSRTLDAYQIDSTAKFREAWDEGPGAELFIQTGWWLKDHLL